MKLINISDAAPIRLESNQHKVSNSYVCIVLLRWSLQWRWSSHTSSHLLDWHQLVRRKPLITSDGRVEGCCDTGIIFAFQVVYRLCSTYDCTIGKALIQFCHDFAGLVQREPQDWFFSQVLKQSWRNQEGCSRPRCLAVFAATPLSWPPTPSTGPFPCAVQKQLQSASHSKSLWWNATFKKLYRFLNWEAAPSDQ